jgi:hypothetical protein
VRAFHSAHGGYWEVMGLKPFKVLAHQSGERWEIRVTPFEAVYYDVSLRIWQRRENEGECP